MDKERAELLKKITSLDFLAEDLHLFLNTHPDDHEALDSYNAAVCESCELKQCYEKEFGMLTDYCSTSSSPWEWINQPWPWEYEANFRLCDEEK